MNREKHFHPLAALHLLRKTLLVYLLPLVQVLFDRNWDALRAALRQEYVNSVLGDLRNQLNNTYVMDEKGNKTKLTQWSEDRKLSK